MYKNKMLDDGGVMQEGGTVDEISGNEVPPGSLKEEVRDDIDAKLSVGEYIFPADVTRYYGLAKLEQMRKEAQDNLKQMENGGRMGNSEQVSEEASDEYNDKDFSGAADQTDQEYDGEAGYAEGGVVKSYAPGGIVPEGYDPAVNAEVYKRAPIKGFEMIPMEDGKGGRIFIPFINGKPQLNIPPGYYIRAADTPKAETPATDSTVLTAPAAGSAQDQPRGGGSERGLSEATRDFLSNESEADRDARLSSFTEGAGDALNSAAKTGLFGIAGIFGSAITRAYNNLSTDPNSNFGPYGFGYTTDSGPGARLAVPKALQMAVDKNISPNEALASVMSDDGDFGPTAQAAAAAQLAKDAQDARDAAEAANRAQDARDAAEAADRAATSAANQQAAAEAQAAADRAQDARDAAEAADRVATADADGHGGGIRGSISLGSRDGVTDRDSGYSGRGGDSGGDSGGSAAGAAARGGMGFGGTGSGI
jgi:hypothetical protein